MGQSVLLLRLLRIPIVVMKYNLFFSYTLKKINFFIYFFMLIKNCYIAFLPQGVKTSNFYNKNQFNTDAFTIVTDFILFVFKDK